MIQTAQISQSSVFLVSGGAKGITAECVIRMAHHQPSKFILLGRSSIMTDEPDWAKDCFDESELKKRIMNNILAQGNKPTPMEVQQVFKTIVSSREIHKTLLAIEQAGAQADYIDVDVTDALALQQKLATVVERMGPITGIIHGAGVLADKLIEKKSEQDFETVYATKVKGLQNLLSCVSPGQLDYLVLFSSVAGFYGNIGQSDYAIANEILNKSAHLVKQHHPSCHVVAINWGPWDSGMVTSELKKAFAKRNIEIIPIPVGTNMLVKELDTANQETAQVVIGTPLEPVLGEFNPELRTYRIRRKLTLDANPFLQDHVIGGYPVLPATCAVAWIINACEQLYPGYKFFSYTNFKVLKGIIFNDTLASEYILDLKEIAKTNDGSIEFEGKIWSKKEQSKIPYHEHYRAQIKLVREIPSAPTYETVNVEEDHQLIEQLKSPSYQTGQCTLFHGSSFWGVKRVLNISATKITAACAWSCISDRQQGQFPIQTYNPYIADIQTHPTGILIYVFHQDELLPCQGTKIEQFAMIPPGETFYVSTELKYKINNNVQVDIIAHNREGQIYSRWLGWKGTIFPLESKAI
ncbi:SDR family NAD(P)-dependent oxidoreductase [Moorena producens JHB]|uniref:SDR family NAD(P)-dependent oxidoreductase n=1 Tax=Moorena producens (strain JHB) TaxID=1454205 RepID=A0A1D9FXT9_MOOP1|nr:SDR family NAD(P)-dependent oxidoreductase [Moorena producens]AOY80151.1 SDR family NAD(P)-dependent oxidoreductase [Moorena producens JHB]